MKLVNWQNLRSWPLGSYGPIGIDIGAHTVKAVQIRRVRKDIEIIAAVSLPRAGQSESPQQVAARIGAVLGRQNFHGRDVVLAAPPKRLEVELLDLPPRSSGAPLELMARTELARSASMASTPFESASWDLATSDRPGAGTSLMAVALRHSDADELVDGFAAEGLIVRAIDVAACACGRACVEQASAPTMLAVVDLGWTAFRLVLVAGGVVHYQRVLSDSGLNALREEIETRLGVAPDIAQFVIQSIGIPAGADAPSPVVESLNIDPGEAIRIRSIITRHVELLTSELKVSFAFASHRFPELPIKELIIGGGGGSIPGLASALSARFDTAAKLWKTPFSSDRADPSLMLATGLALYEEN